MMNKFKKSIKRDVFCRMMVGGDKRHFYDTHDTILLTTQMVTLVLGKRIAAKILSFFCSFQEDLEAVDEPDWTLTDWRCC